MTKWESCSFISLCRDRINCPTTTKCRIHLLEEILASVEKSDTRVRHNLMSSPDIEVDTILRHIGRHMWKPLTAIENEKWFCRKSVEYRLHSLQIQNLPGYIRCSSNRENFRMRKLRFKRIIVYRTIIMKFDPINDDTILFGKYLPWNNIGMMFDF